MRINLVACAIWGVIGFVVVASGLASGQGIEDIQITTPPFLNESGVAGWRRYGTQPTVKAFAISSTGAWGYARSKTSDADAGTDAISRCESFGAVCVVYAVNDEVVWFDPLDGARPKPAEAILSTKRTSAEFLLNQESLTFSHRTNRVNFAKHRFSAPRKTYAIQGYTAQPSCFSGQSDATFSINANADIEIYAPYRAGQVTGCPAIRAIVDPISKIMYVYEESADKRDRRAPQFYRLDQ